MVEFHENIFLGFYRPEHVYSPIHHAPTHCLSSSDVPGGCAHGSTYTEEINAAPMRNPIAGPNATMAYKTPAMSRHHKDKCNRRRTNNDCIVQQVFGIILMAKCLIN